MSKNGKPKRQKVKTIDRSTLPALPPEWSWATIDALAAPEPHSITDGPFGSNLKTSHYTSEGPRVIRLQNIGDGTFVDELAHISEDHFETLNKHHVHGGDIVIAALGETLPRSCVIPPWVGPALVKADCPRFKPNQEIITAEYANYALNSPQTRNRTSAIIHGVGRPRLNLSEIRGTWLPVAPPNEQRRIVAKIEELFSDLDAGVAALERAKANLKRYRAAVLKAAVEGQLTAAWRAENPCTEPAADMLARTTRKHSPKKVRRDVPDQVLLTNEASVIAIPKGWTLRSTTELLRAGAIIDVKDGNHGANHPKKGEFSAEGLPFITAAEVNDGRIDYEGAPKVTGVVLEKLRVGFAQPDDVILTHKGSVGRVAICDRPCVLTPQTTYYRLRDNVFCPSYLQHYFASPQFFHQLVAVKSQTTRDYVPISKQYRLFILVPPFEEQTRIAEEVDRVLSIVDEAEVLLEVNRKRAVRLRQSILKRAFEGKLVPQDSTDEPASALLQRIRSDRTPTAVPGRTKRPKNGKKEITLTETS